MENDNHSRVTKEGLSLLILASEAVDVRISKLGVLLTHAAVHSFAPQIEGTIRSVSDWGMESEQIFAGCSFNGKHDSMDHRLKSTMSVDYNPHNIYIC
jgi:hypothetical protein